MKKLLFSLLFASSFLSAEEPAKQNKIVQSAIAGLQYACVSKNIFELLYNLPENHPYYSQKTIISSYLDLLKKPCGVTVVEHKDTTGIIPLLNPEFYQNLYDGKFAWSEQDASDQFLYTHYFSVVLDILKQKMAGQKLNADQLIAAQFLITLLTEDLTVIKEKVNVVKAMEETLVQ